MFKHPAGAPDNDHVLCLKFNNRISFTTKMIIYFICGRLKRDNSNTKIENVESSTIF